MKSGKMRPAGIAICDEHDHEHSRSVMFAPSAPFTAVGHMIN
jgi:hypothetical protein